MGRDGCVWGNATTGNLDKVQNVRLVLALGRKEPRAEAEGDDDYKTDEWCVTGRVSCLF